MNNFQPCMLCQSKDFQEMKSHDLFITGLKTIKVTYGLCKKCGHIYQNPLPDPKTIDAYYSEFSNYFNFDSSKELPLKAESLTTKRILEVASKYVPPKGSIYEIGCGSGIHLFYLQKKGWLVSGCEPSEATGAQAKKMLSADIEIGFADECFQRKKKYDAILLSHVLEHVPDPEKLINLAKENIKDSGIVILEVPCSRKAKKICPGWLTLEHLSYFSEEALAFLVNKCGLKIAEIVIDDDDGKCPTITVVCKKNLKDKKQIETQFYNENLAFLEEYLEIDLKYWGKLNEKFQNIGEAFIWAAGVHTAQLFVETDILKMVNVISIVDSSPLKCGEKQGPYSVIDRGQFLNEYKGQNVIISSYKSENEIFNSLIKMGIKKDKIVKLYS